MVKPGKAAVAKCIDCKCYRYSAWTLTPQPHHECRRNKSPIDGRPMVLDAEAERRLTTEGHCGPDAEYWASKSGAAPRELSPDLVPSSFP